MVNAAEAPLLKGKTHIPTVRSMVTSKGKVPIQTAQDALVTEMGSDVRAHTLVANPFVASKVPWGLKFVKKSSKEQPCNDSRAPLTLSGDPEVGPSKPGPEGHSCIGSKISKPPPLPQELDWTGNGSQFSFLVRYLPKPVEQWVHRTLKNLLCPCDLTTLT